MSISLESGLLNTENGDYSLIVFSDEFNLVSFQKSAHQK